MEASLCEIKTSVRANTKLLSTIIRGEHDCPRWMIVLPKKPKGAVDFKWLQPKNWASTTVVLAFVCPVSMHPPGEGFEVQLPHGWVKELGPVFLISMSVLIGLKEVGVEIPVVSAAARSLQEATDGATNFLSGALEGLHEQLGEHGLGDVAALADCVVEKVGEGISDGLKGRGLPDLMVGEEGGGSGEDEDAEEVEEEEEEVVEEVASDEEEESEEEMGQTKKAVRESYRRVAALLDSIAKTERLPIGAEGRMKLLGDSTRCGLVKAVHAKSGDVEWVAAKYKRAFEQHGQNILGKHARRGASQKAAQVTAPQVTALPLERRSSVVGDVTKLASLVDSALPEVPKRKREEYVQLLAEAGCSAEYVARLSAEDWPNSIKPLHRKRLVEAAGLQNGACCRCLQ